MLPLTRKFLGIVNALRVGLLCTKKRTLVSEDAATKAKGVKRIKRRLEKKAPGEKARRSGGKKAPSSPPQPNQYLLGGRMKPQEPELAFLYEVATCALKVVQLRVCSQLLLWFELLKVESKVK